MSKPPDSSDDSPGIQVSRLRWLAKKAARAGVAFGSWASGGLAAQRLLAPGPRVRALIYHRFGEGRGDPYQVSTSAFEAQMRWLAEQGRLVSLDDVTAFVAGRRELAPDAVLVTIDDGCRSLYTQALPILRAYGVPAVAFVSAGLIGTEAVGADHGEGFLAWDELGRIREGGIEVGSHAWSHRSLGRISQAEALDEAARSRRVLEERLGAPVRSFAYPFGTRADFSPETDRLLEQAGYAIAFNSMHGAIRPGMAPVSLSRVKIEGGEGLRFFKLAAGGAMDAWRVVDHLLWRAQQVRAETSAE
jgi:peptidoglycan/xylan/chitin deacetylase (PgdA/CDA1 family)